MTSELKGVGQAFDLPKFKALFTDERKDLVNLARTAELAERYEGTPQYTVHHTPHIAHSTQLYCIVLYCTGHTVSTTHNGATVTLRTLIVYTVL